ncbi:MAG: ABC transporter ATP-binding protein [Prevotella sp.]|nr:ABC transporter ATP-binding protein [Prevotella sp.]
MRIEIEQLSKSFGEKKALDVDHLSFSGEGVIGLVGNNGAGKTTLFRLLLDLLKADTGHVTYFFGDDSSDSSEGIDPAHSEEWKHHTGAYIDDGFLIDFLTPEEYFSFVGKVSGLTEAEVMDRLHVFEALMAGEILCQKKLIRDFSAGNKHKIGIIAAMLNHPKLVILDEPFNFLDPTSQNVLKHTLEQYAKEYGATVFVSSHNLAHTVEISQRIILLESGHVINDLDNQGRAAEKELEDYFNVEG